MLRPVAVSASTVAVAVVQPAAPLLPSPAQLFAEHRSAAVQCSAGTRRWLLSDSTLCQSAACSRRTRSASVSTLMMRPPVRSPPALSQCRCMPLPTTHTHYTIFPTPPSVNGTHATLYSALELLARCTLQIYLLSYTPSNFLKMANGAKIKTM